MLVLTRAKNEGIRVGRRSDPDAIAIRVVAVMGTKVRLGIEAPKHVPILREELIELEPPESEQEQSPT